MNDGQAFSLKSPKQRTTCAVFASPHSGRQYPAAFLRQSVLSEREIRSSEDAYVDILFGAAPLFGAPLLAANAPRAYVDLNRGADELDPALVRDVPKSSSNPRISSGLGVIPRVVANGRAIYRGKIDRSEAICRLNRVWHPYHACLDRLVQESCSMFGRAILVDCHSMPHEAIEVAGRHGCRPDVVLGDRYGASASRHIVDQMEEAFVAAGLTVARNAPFAGAFTAQHYGRPSRGQHVVQVEIDRSLYMNEATLEPTESFDEVKAALTEVIAAISMIGRSDMPLAAE